MRVCWRVTTGLHIPTPIVDRDNRASHCIKVLQGNFGSLDVLFVYCSSIGDTRDAL